MALVYALITVLAWGTWLAPSHAVHFRREQARTFYVTAANLVLAIVVGMGHGLTRLDVTTAFLCLIAGVIWTGGGFLAFRATRQLGIAGAMGIWSPLNILFSVMWGFLLFGELRSLRPSGFLFLFTCLICIIFGIQLILRGTASNKDAPGKGISLPAVLCALGAGLIWGSYFLPMRYTTIPVWETVLPFSCGMFLGSLAGLGRQPLKNLLLHRPHDYALACSSGLLWGLGNYGSLKLMEYVGTGKGFTIAQLCIVVNALVGILVFKDPPPRSRKGQITFVGVLVAGLGGVLLGNLRM